MAQAETRLEDASCGLSSRLLAMANKFRANAQQASGEQHLVRGKRKRADGYSEADNRFIIQSVQSADQEGKPIPWEWIGSNLQRTTGAVKKQYQRIKPNIDKLSASDQETENKKPERVERAKERQQKRLLFAATPDGDDTSAEESHSSESQLQTEMDLVQQEKLQNIQSTELKISSKDAWAAIMDSDVSIEVAANGLLALKSASPTSPDDDFF